MMEASPGEAVTLRPVTTAEHGQIRQWLRDAGVQRWWGNANAAEAEIALALASESALCRLIMLSRTPIGYVHALDAAELGDGPKPTGVRPGTYDCDLFIGSDIHRGKGHGQRALELIVEEVFATTLAPACSIVVSIRNERAVRAYEAAGFSWSQVWQDPVTGPAWVMLRERPHR